jgi:hypothetical protein
MAPGVEEKQKMVAMHRKQKRCQMQQQISFLVLDILLKDVQDSSINMLKLHALPPFCS